MGCNNINYTRNSAEAEELHPKGASRQLRQLSSGEAVIPRASPPLWGRLWTLPILRLVFQSGYLTIQSYGAAIARYTDPFF